MMSRNRITAIAFIVLCTLTSVAQTPSGYLGKRMIVSYNFVSFPRFYTVLFEEELSFRYKHVIELEYITQRKKSLGVSFAYHNFETELKDYNFDDFGKNNSFPRNESPVGNSTAFENRSFYAGAFIRIFHSNIAPLGTFSRIGVDQITSSVSLRNELTSQDSNLYIPNISSDDVYYSIMVSYSIGTQRVLFDKLVVRFAIKSGYVFGGMKETRIGIVDNFFDGLLVLEDLFEPTTDKFTYSQNVTKNSLLNQNIISVTLGIGFLVY